MGPFTGAGAGQYAEGGVRTGRQADPGYKRPQPEQQPSSPSGSAAGFAGEHCKHCSFTRFIMQPSMGP